MKKAIFTCFLLLMATTECQANEKEKVFFTIEKLFSAMSKNDPKTMKEAATDSFILLEHGEVWGMDELVKAASPSGYVRTNYFNIINVDIKSEIAVVNYWNKANFDNKQNKEEVVWLESAVLKKMKGQWLISQMHSTRLPSGKIPKNVTFTMGKE